MTGLMGWLGRQVGHVRKAIRTRPAAEKVIYREDRIEEAPLPDRPQVKLRRTTIDEVIIQRRDPNDPDHNHPQ